MISNEVQYDIRPFKILPSFHDSVLEADADIYLLWGGRDRGASHFSAQRAIIDCLNDDYYRAVLIRKTYESIRDSQWQTIKDIVEDAGLIQFFTFVRSPLEIRSTENENKFICRGCDDPAKLKSTRDPNVAIIEEADQLTEEDFITLYTTLRHPTAKVRIWMNFNSDFPGDYKDHWIWRYYLQHIPNTYQSGLYETTIQVPVGDEMVDQVVKFYSMHSTYKDNPYCPPSRKAVYENLKEKNPYYYKVYAKGLLGKKENDNKWAWALSEPKHFENGQFQPNINYPVVLSYDFNHDPCVLVAGQYEQHLPRFTIFAYFKASSGSQSALKQLCDRVQREFPHHARTRQLVVTGDASGKQRDASRPSNINRYTDIIKYLGISPNAVQVERSNSTHKASRDLCNDVLDMLPKGIYRFTGGMGCEMLLSEIQDSYPDSKESLTEYKKKEGGHGVDAWRYLNQYFFNHKNTGTNFRLYKRKIQAVINRIKK